MLFLPFSFPVKPRRRLLYVGTDLAVLQTLKDELSDEGWFVVRSPGGNPAVLLLESEIHYDLLVFDEELAGTSGMELVRLARSVEHRRRTPMILLSFADCAIAARRAGADKCLRKPDHLYALAETVREVSSRFKVRGSRFEG
jgi:DNA-binding response OmpR family regulator